MVPTSRRTINRGRPRKTWAAVTFLALLLLTAGLPTRAQDHPPPPRDAASVMDRALAFLRDHPRVRGRFEHLYLDRPRTIELRATGRFAIELPRIGIQMDEGDARTIAIDATTARVLVPRDGDAPLLLAFRIETTPLPALLAVIAGATGVGDAYAIRAIDAAEDDVIELRPTEAGSQVDRIWLDLDSDGALERVMIVDWRGATHRIVLTELEYPRRIPESALAPTFPADAVVVEP